MLLLLSTCYGRLFGVIKLVKEYCRLVDQVGTDNQLRLDAYKKLLNIYTEISGMPDSPFTSPPADKPFTEMDIAMIPNPVIKYLNNSYYFKYIYILVRI